MAGNKLSPLDILLGNTPEGAAAKAEIEAQTAADARFNPKPLGRPTCYPADGKPCERCKGRGVIDAFRHVANGQCFACEGWGVRRGG